MKSDIKPQMLGRLSLLSMKNTIKIEKQKKILTLHHIVIQMVDDPNREEDNDDHNGKKGNENTNIPIGPFFAPDIEKK